MKNRIIALVRNNQQMIGNMGGSLLIKGLALVVSFAATPAYIKYFDNNIVLGVWFTITATMFWILSMDFGIGNGLRNKLTECFNKGEVYLAKKYISSSYVLFTIGMLVVAIPGIIAAHNVNWIQYFSMEATSVTNNAVALTVSIVFIAICMQLILKLVSSVLYALQKAMIPNLLALITSVIQYLFVSFYISGTVQNRLVTLAWVFLLSVNVPLLVATLYVFRRKIRECAPSFREFSWNVSRSMLGLSGNFMVVQLLFMAIASTNEIMITSVAGTQYVVEYSVYYKLYSLLSLATAVVLTPVWSAVTQKMVCGEYSWLKKLLYALNIYVVLAGLLQIILALFSSEILRLWVGEAAIEFQSNISFIFAVYGIALTTQNVYSTIACGLSRLRIQIVCYTVGVVAKIIIGKIISVGNLPWYWLIISNTLILLVYSGLELLSIRKYLMTRFTEAIYDKEVIE